jgi:hypothetical protein
MKAFIIGGSIPITPIQQREMSTTVDDPRLPREGFGELHQLGAFFRFHDAAKRDHDAKSFFI